MLNAHRKQRIKTWDLDLAASIHDQAAPGVWSKDIFVCHDTATCDFPLTLASNKLNNRVEFSSAEVAFVDQPSQLPVHCRRHSAQRKPCDINTVNCALEMVAC